ncbi:tape measure protein [Pseudochrobactrum asaccharolyticum]|uniref:Tape measure domain-containing protein n=1 Tax=Pseudochrobactrum asaccharolyticum TaxID=354351 RepID=A0A366DLT8_9HYPH|nr:tape measure protein [Pseudochrobactrum asaccharolyticum]RBO91021.1 tape measure domain-containing protein [Pseudochrobactrum asaccharolyticum]
MSEAILNLVVNSKGVPEANEGLEKLTGNADRAEKSAKGLTSTVGLLSGALGALGISLGVMAVKNAADSWSDMNARLGLAVGSADKATAVMQRLQSVAKNTYSDINTTTESFIANAGVLRDLGKSTAQALDYTEALNNALVVSGAKAETAASVQEAMSRAMALGKLSGDQLNTVLAKGGEVAAVLAAELGVSQIQLRKMGQEGKITGDVIYSALTNRLEELREKAGSMPATMQDAATAWSNAFTTIVGTVDQATGASGALGQALYDLGYQVAEQAGTIAQAFVAMQMIGGQAIEAISTAFSGMFGDFDTGSAMIIAGVGLVGTALVGLSSIILGPVVGAFAAMTAAILANPIGLLVGALAAAGAALYLFGDQINQILGFDVGNAARAGGNYILGAFVGTYNAVLAVWNNFPAAFELTWKTGVNSVLDVMIWWAGKLEVFFAEIPTMLGDAMENFPIIFANAVRGAVKLGVDAISWMVNQAISLLNKMLSGVRWLLDQVGIQMQELGSVDIGAGIADLPMVASRAAGKMKNVLTGLKFELSDQAKETGDLISDAYSKAFSEDHLGGIVDGLGKVWTAAGDATNQIKDMNAALEGDAGSGMGGALGDGSGGKGGKGKGGGGKDEKSRAAEKLARDMEKRLEALKEAHRNEEEVQLAKYQKDLETLQWHLDQKKLTEQEFLEWKERVTRDHEAKMLQIRAAGFSDSLTATGEFFGALASVMGGNNDKLLRVQKTFAAAAALVNAYLAASQALADPTVPFWGKFAAVAAVLAKGMALVGAIKSGSNSGGGGSAGTTQSAAPQEKAPPRQMAEINVHGEVFNREQVIGLIEKINDVQKDGHVISWKGI